ncbi:MAG: sigma-70 family RNA polymerase sigma factor [Actinobacteria bacterium]|nr:sigma-70 family RNA polymerase sigma factor [Actinomycetota bacterium]
MLEGSFEERVREHLPAMWALAWRLVGPDAADVHQEALLQAWRTADRYDEKRGSIRTWLLVLVADRCRKRNRRLRAQPQWVELPLHVPAPPGDVDSRVDLDRAIAALPARQRLAVELHYVLGLDVAETAAVMRCAVGTVKSTLYDARARLRTALEVAP